VLADIGDEQSIGQSLSTFSGHMTNLAQIVNQASQRTLVVLDEVGVGTDPSEGAALAQAILETLADAGARVIATTHYGLLKEMADVDPRFANASVDFDPETLAPTYRLRVGLPGSSSATAVAARMGLRSDVLERANSSSRARTASSTACCTSSPRAARRSRASSARRTRLRQESEAVRTEYRHKLEKLSQRRDELYRAMREDLDAQFKNAHAQIAAVIRDLQRAAGRPPPRRTRARARAAGVARRAAARERGGGGDRADPTETLVPVDWNRARAGDAVKIAGGKAGVLSALPDRRGRVAVTVGSLRMVVPGGARRARRARRSRVEPGSRAATCVIRRRRHRALRPARPARRRGARRARRRAGSRRIGRPRPPARDPRPRHRRAAQGGARASRGVAYVARLEAAEPSEGGDGASVAHLR
jgi:DNA mismatch repair protein MutS2